MHAFCPRKLTDYRVFLALTSARVESAARFASIKKLGGRGCLGFYFIIIFSTLTTGWLREGFYFPNLLGEVAFCVVHRSGV